eukprot:scaffold29786_cov20-Tisochrysis_lutea.AAC.1
MQDTFLYHNRAYIQYLGSQGSEAFWVSSQTVIWQRSGPSTDDKIKNSAGAHHGTNARRKVTTVHELGPSVDTLLVQNDK